MHRAVQGFALLHMWAWINVLVGDITMRPTKPLNRRSVDFGQFDTGASNASSSKSCLHWIDSELALSHVAQAIRNVRIVRRAEFGADISEPAWDMLIELYSRESTGDFTTGSLLKDAASVPTSTARRWLKHLAREGFIRIRPHPAEPEIEFVELTDRARVALERVFMKVRSVFDTGLGTPVGTPQPKLGR